MGILGSMVAKLSSGLVSQVNIELDDSRFTDRRVEVQPQQQRRVMKHGARSRNNTETGLSGHYILIHKVKATYDTSVTLFNIVYTKVFVETLMHLFLPAAIS